MAPRNFEPLAYYRWYWRDYRASRRVQRLSYIARGLYRELLDECWVAGSIPDDVTKLSEICGCPVKVMEANWSKLKQMFAHAGDGLYISERLENERTETDQLRAMRAVSGRRGGLARKQMTASAKQMEANVSNLLSSSSSSSSSSSRAEQSSSSAVSSIAGMTPIGTVLAAPDGTGARTAKQWRGR